MFRVLRGCNLVATDGAAVSLENSLKFLRNSWNILGILRETPYIQSAPQSAIL